MSPYKILTTYLDSLIANGTYLSYAVVELLNPQSIGVVKSFQLSNGMALIVYEIVNGDTQTRTLIENYA